MKNEVEAAKELFSDKPFLVQFRTFKNLAFIGRIGFGFFSIITGFGFIFSLMSGLNMYVAAFLAFGFLAFIEVLKNLLSQNAFIEHYKGNSTAGALALPALCVFLLSVFFSLHGAKEIYKQVDNRQAEILSAHNAKKDSIAAFFEAQTIAVTAEIQDFKKSVSWRGKIDISNKATKDEIRRFSDKLSNIEAERKKALNSAENEYLQQKNAIQDATQFNSTLWLALSGLIEVFIMLCLWFLTYYSYRIAKESELIAGAETYTLDLQTLQNLAQYKQLAPPNLQPVIGFNMRKNTQDAGMQKKINSSVQGQQTQGLNGGVNGFKDVNYLNRYSNVVHAIEQGLSNKEISRVTGVSISTVHNVKRCLR